MHIHQLTDERHVFGPVPTEDDLQLLTQWLRAQGARLCEVRRDRALASVHIHGEEAVPACLLHEAVLVAQRVSAVPVRSEGLADWERDLPQICLTYRTRRFHCSITWTDHIPLAAGASPRALIALHEAARLERGRHAVPLRVIAGVR